MDYERSIRVDLPYADAQEKVRSALAEQGFGVLTEIDVRATMKVKLGTDMEDYTILGACNPTLAERALSVDRSIGVLLPCNVVVRADGDGSIVQILDPMLMAAVTGLPGLAPVAEEADTRLRAVLESMR